eukprot:CAMPEP_0176425884 /NCGR_PEP_ID=MMETSP0127-20121128/11633_1 /TAXON_ID=938130 /ORGANISM="Platyophrya macrostoma, Strain WH" /LENGTH=873 /DNA_ID=CAMNT_0017807087 /DNA_START=1018 /DNA_END=3640 /DNA_ORIENTATION=-
MLAAHHRPAARRKPLDHLHAVVGASAVDQDDSVEHRGVVVDEVRQEELFVVEVRHHHHLPPRRVKGQQRQPGRVEGVDHRRRLGVHASPHPKAEGDQPLLGEGQEHPHKRPVARPRIARHRPVDPSPNLVPEVPREHHNHHVPAALLLAQLRRRLHRDARPGAVRVLLQRRVVHHVPEGEPRLEGKRVQHQHHPLGRCAVRDDVDALRSRGLKRRRHPRARSHRPSAVVHVERITRHPPLRVHSHRVLDRSVARDSLRLGQRDEARAPVDRGDLVLDDAQPHLRRQRLERARAEERDVLVVHGVELPIGKHLALRRLQVQQRRVVHHLDARSEERGGVGNVRKDVLRHDRVDLLRQLLEALPPHRAPQPRCNLVAVADRVHHQVGRRIHAVRLPPQPLEVVQLRPVVARDLKDREVPRPLVDTADLLRDTVRQPPEVLVQRPTRAAPVAVVREERLPVHHRRQLRVVALAAPVQPQREAGAALRVLRRCSEVIRQWLVPEVQHLHDVMRSAHTALMRPVVRVVHDLAAHLHVARCPDELQNRLLRRHCELELEQLLEPLGAQREPTYVVAGVVVERDGNARDGRNLVRLLPNRTGEGNKVEQIQRARLQPRRRRDQRVDRSRKVLDCEERARRLGVPHVDASLEQRAAHHRDVHELEPLAWRNADDRPEPHRDEPRKLAAMSRVLGELSHGNLAPVHRSGVRVEQRNLRRVFLGEEPVRAESLPDRRRRSKQQQLARLHPQCEVHHVVDVLLRHLLLRVRLAPHAAGEAPEVDDDVRLVHGGLRHVAPVRAHDVSKLRRSRVAVEALNRIRPPQCVRDAAPNVAGRTNDHNSLLFQDQFISSRDFASGLSGAVGLTASACGSAVKLASSLDDG